MKTRGQTNGLFLCLLPPQYGASAEARIFPPQKALTLLRLLIAAFVLWETGHTERGGKGCPKNICIEYSFFLFASIATFAECEASGFSFQNLVPKTC